MKFNVLRGFVEFKIPLTQGQFTIVDEDVYEWASKLKWFAAHWKNGFYACRGGKMTNGIRKPNEALHRTIMNPPEGMMIDHINGNTLDNRRDNLRICSNTQNQRNQQLSKRNTVGYKGVSWHQRHKKWIARIRVNNRLIHLGYYTDLIEGAKAYDVAAIKYYGEFANINFK